MAKTMKTSPDHRAANVDSLSDLGLFNLPRTAGQTLMSMAEKAMQYLLPLFLPLQSEIRNKHIFEDLRA